MFRASSAHLQEDTVVYMRYMVLSLSVRVPDGTRNSHREWQYHMLYVYNCILLKMSTWGSKHVEENIILWINNNCQTLNFTKICPVAAELLHANGRTATNLITARLQRLFLLIYIEYWLEGTNSTAQIRNHYTSSNISFPTLLCRTHDRTNGTMLTDRSADVRYTPHS